MAERLLASRLAERLGTVAAGAFEVCSAGTFDLGGEPMDPLAAKALASFGVGGDGHVARPLARGDVVAADLVLGMAREHRGAAIVLLPQVAGRAFALLELARLCGAVDPVALHETEPVARARAIVALAASQRGLVHPKAPEDDDLADPLGAPLEVFQETAALIDSALLPFLDLLVPRPGSPVG